MTLSFQKGKQTVKNISAQITPLESHGDSHKYFFYLSTPGQYSLEFNDTTLFER